MDLEASTSPSSSPEPWCTVSNETDGTDDEDDDFEIISSDIPELTETNYLKPTDHHHPKSDQKQEHDTGSSSQGCSPRGRLSDLPESRAERTTNYIEKHAQLFQSKDEMNSENPQLTKEKHLEPTDNHYPKSDQKQEHDTGSSSQGCSPRGRLSDLPESRAERTTNDLEEHAQLFQSKDEMNSENPELTKETYLEPTDNHYPKSDQKQELDTGSSSQGCSPRERLSDLPESRAERTNNDLEEHAQLLQSNYEMNSENPELTKKIYLEPTDNHYPKSDQKQELDTGSSSQGCSPRERLSDLPESRAERTNNDLEEHAQLLQSNDEMNSENPELTQEKYLEPTDNHYPKSDQKQEHDTSSSSQGCSPRERLSPLPESRAERTNNDLEEHAQLLQSNDEMNSENPELTNEKYLEPTDNHYPKSDQKQELDTGSSSEGCSPRERLSDLPESVTERSNNDLEEHAQLFQSKDEKNSENPELTKEIHLESTNNHYPKSDQKQEHDTGSSSQGCSPRERLSDLPESVSERSNNDLEKHAQLLQSNDEMNSENPELTKEKHLESTNNHYPKSDQKQEHDTGSSSQGCSPRERLSDLPESVTERSNNDLEEHAQLLQSNDEMNSENPELINEKYLEPTDNHYPKSDQKQELDTGSSSEGCSPRERLSDLPESVTERSNNDLEEHAQLLQSNDEMNSENPELTNEKYLEPTDNHYPKSDQKQEHDTGSSSQGCSPRERLSDLPESVTERSNNDLEEHAQLLQSNDEMNSENPELTNEKYLEPTDNHYPKSDQKQEHDTGSSSQGCSPRERLSDLPESVTERSNNDLEEHAQLLQSNDEMNSENPELTNEKYLEPTDNHYPKSDQKLELDTGSSSEGCSPRERLSDLPESVTERSNNDLEEHAQLLQSNDEMNSENPELTNEKYLEPTDNHYPKSDQQQELDTGSSSEGCSPRERLSDLPESVTERSNNDLEKHAQLLQSNDEMNSDNPELTKEKHLDRTDNHYPKSDQKQEHDTGSSEGCSPRERLSDLPESRAERTNNDLEEHAQLLQSNDEMNSENPVLTNEKYLEPTDNHYPKSDQKQEHDTGSSSQGCSPRERLSDLPESVTERSNNDLEEHAQLLQSNDEMNSENPELTKEKYLEPTDNHYPKSDQQQELDTGSSSEGCSPRERLSDLPESVTERSNNDLEKHAQLLQSNDEMNSDNPELTKEKHLDRTDNHYPKSDQKQEHDTGSSEGCSPRERLSDLPESRAERTNNDLEEHAQLLQSNDEMNSENPVLTNEKYLEPTDNHYPKSDQKQEHDTGSSSQGCSPRERLSDLPESVTERSNNDLEEHAQLLQSNDEMNSENPELTNEKYLEVTDNHYPKSDQQQELDTGSSSEGCSPRERLSDLPESVTERSNNDLEKHAQLLQSNDEMNSDNPELTKEKHLDRTDNHYPKSDQKQEHDTGSSEGCSPRERLSDLPESRAERTNNDLEEHAQLLQSNDEMNSENPELTNEKYLEPTDNHYPKSDQKQEHDTGSSSQGCSPRERLSDLPESVTERSNNDLEEHAQLFQSKDEMNSEIPELTKQKHLEPTDNHYPKSDQKQEHDTGSSEGCSPRERLSDLPESRAERTNNDLEEHAQLLQSNDEMNSENPVLTNEKYLEPTDNHYPKSDQKQEHDTGSSSQGCSPRERLSDLPESVTERSNNDLEEHAQLLQSNDEMNSENPELTNEKYLEPTDNHYPKSDQQQELDTGSSSEGCSPRERLSDLPESVTERSNNDLEKHAQLLQSNDEMNSDNPELTKEKHLDRTDNHYPKSDQKQEHDTGSSEGCSPRERLSDLPESRAERTNNDLEEHAQLLQSNDEMNSENPVLTNEKYLEPTDNHYPKSDQKQELDTGSSSEGCSPRERLSDLPESVTERSNNDLEEHAQLLQSNDEMNSDNPELTKEKHLDRTDNHYPKSDQKQEHDTGSSEGCSPRERLSDLPESRAERTNNDLEEHAQLLQSNDEMNSENPELTNEKYLEPTDNHYPKSDQKQEHDTGSSSQGCSPRERLSDLPESVTERSNNDLEEHAQLFQSKDEMNSEIPELTKQKHLERTDNHYSKSDQKQEHDTGSSEGCSPREGLSDLPESRAERTNNDLEEHAQLFQSKYEMNSENPELTNEKHLEPTDNHYPKSDQKQELDTGSSSQGCSPRERLSDLPESRAKSTNNDLEERAQLFQSKDEMNSEIPELKKGKHLKPTDNHHPKSDQKQKLDTGASSPGTSYRESDTSGVFVGIQPDRLDQPRHEKNGERIELFGNDLCVAGMWKKNRLVELYSCEFSHPRSNQLVYIRMQRPGYLFTFDENDFIARVSVDKLQELDFDQFSVVNIRKILLEKVIFTEIIRDESINYRDDAYMQFIQLVQDRSGKTVQNLECAEDIFQLSGILEKYQKSPTISILGNIVNNKYISSDLIHSCRQLICREKALDTRRKDFSQVDRFHPKNVFLDLYKSCESAIKNHNKSLLDICFSSISQLSYSMDSNINALSGRQVFYISNQDINLFCDLTNEMNEQVFSIFLHNLQDSFFNQVIAINKHASVKKLAPLTHPIYLHLCKHFQELSLEISGKTDMSVNDLLRINGSEISILVTSINWPYSPLNYSLERQYRFIVKLIKHFEPVYRTKRKNFVYQFKLSNNRDDKSWWNIIKSSFVGDKTPNIPEERLVWMYVLDDAIAELFSQKSEKCLELFTPLLDGYTAFIHETEYVHYESFRIVTYSTVRFIAQAIPYISEGASEIDQATLANQIASIKNAISHKQFIDFRDLVDVYNEYWKNRESFVENIPDKFPYGKFKDDMEGIRKKLYNIVNTVLSTEVKSQELIKYFRSFNEFLEDLSAVEFSWFIKEIRDLTAQEVVLVNEGKKSYKVLDPKNFIEKHANIPGHYLIEIIDDLLISVINLLGQKKWSNYDNINAASELVSAIKKSFLYLKEQPDYISFDTFKEESTKPFASVVENSSSYEDFIKRVDIIGESFWYLRKQDEIDITKALMLYRTENENVRKETGETLIHCYCKYLEKFNSHIELTCNKNYLHKIEFITKEVKDQLQCNHFDEWREDFKQETLPELLAGLAAVWSVQASKDIVNASKTIKPHCIQVLCILLLLSVDKDYPGVDNHFAQVLTGQGKSLVLGLTASLLALMGHNVRIVCYSKYLATRDQENFDNLFRVFGIKHKITYGTFDDMAMEILQPIVNEETLCLADLVRKRILYHSTGQFEQLKYDDRSNTILLIDEVDVFFSSNFYGNRYSACKRIYMPAIADIQENIWEMVSRNNAKSIILDEIKEFIKKKTRERNQDFNHFNRFLIEPGKYYLLNESHDTLVKKEYTNQSLYEEHLNNMIDDAIFVATASNNHRVRSSYKINDCGLITYRKTNGFYSPNVLWNYYNVFNYFRLKKVNYSNKEFVNYGYLKVDSGAVSYAKLPKEYPLILGVTGTLNRLNDHEREAVINSYNIHENSIMPSYFGNCNLQFNKYRDFSCETSEEQWLSKIDSRANTKIGSGRSVLIFFDRDVEIDKFVDKFRSKFDRLHKLDENTEKQTKEKYINEAGITKTVTLATRGMGRGVDFKSSVAVEKNGGVHVIQTFFSLDIKEETQIKGRTARKDNKGSYELIVCKEDLINAKLLDAEKTIVNYDSLSEAREKIMQNEYANIEDRIKNMDERHSVTMQFFESFFKSKCSTRIEQPTVKSSEKPFEEPPQEPEVIVHLNS